MDDISTCRMTLRNFRPCDAEELQKIAIDKENSPYAFSDHEWPVTLDEIEGVCNWFSSGDDFLAVVVRDEMKVIGFVSLVLEDEDGVKNLGYCIHSSYQGKGYGYEACKALMAREFALGKTQKIVTGTGHDNKPSVKMLEKLGFILKHTQKSSLSNDANANPVEFEGAWFELVKGGFIS